MAGKLLRAVAVAAIALAPNVVALWPNPATLTEGTSALRLSNSFGIKVNVKNAPSDLQDAVTRTLSFIRNDKLERLVVGRGSVDAAAVSASRWLHTLNVGLTNGAQVHSIATEAVKDLTTRDDSYTLTVPDSGAAATLTANSTLGLLRGLTTFSQLWYSHDGATYAINTPVQIADKPAFPYRGFMLDTARNFFPVSDILRTLDTMASVKLNVFHWHVVDSQSFPLEVPALPELSAKGAYSSSMVYSPSDVQTIVNYAAERGIDVMLEIDTPGHTDIIARSHPDLIACDSERPWATFANEPPAGQLRFANNGTAAFVSELFQAVASVLPGKLFSTGGDELNVNCYANDTETQAALKASGKTLEQALSDFTVATHAALRAKGKTPVVWEEMVLVHNVTLGNDTIAMVWISSDDVGAVAEKGFRIVHAASDFFYLDCGHGGWVGDFPTGNSWCDPYKTWQKIYTFDPFNGTTTADQRALVLGGEALLWTEQSDSTNLDAQAWPRGITQAEVFWTGANGPDGQPRNIDTALPRLHEQRFRLVARGVQANPLQPLWCALRPGICDLTA